MSGVGMLACRWRPCCNARAVSRRRRGRRGPAAGDLHILLHPAPFRNDDGRIPGSVLPAAPGVGGAGRAPDLGPGLLVEGDDHGFRSSGSADEAIPVDEGRFAEAPAAHHDAAEVLGEILLPDDRARIRLRADEVSGEADRINEVAVDLGRAVAVAAAAEGRAPEQLAVLRREGDERLALLRFPERVYLAGRDGDSGVTLSASLALPEQFRTALGPLCEQPVSVEMPSRFGPRQPGQSAAVVERTEKNEQQDRKDLGFHGLGGGDRAENGGIWRVFSSLSRSRLRVILADHASDEKARPPHRGKPAGAGEAFDHEDLVVEPRFVGSCACASRSWPVGRAVVLAPVAEPVDVVAPIHPHEPVGAGIEVKIEAGSIVPVSRRARVTFPFFFDPRNDLEEGLVSSVSATSVQAQTSNLAGSPSRSLPPSHQYFGASRMDSRVLAFRRIGEDGAGVEPFLHPEDPQEFPFTPGGRDDLVGECLGLGGGFRCCRRGARGPTGWRAGRGFAWMAGFRRIVGKTPMDGNADLRIAGPRSPHHPRGQAEKGADADHIRRRGQENPQRAVAGSAPNRFKARGMRAPARPLTTQLATIAIQTTRPRIQASDCPWKWA